MIITESKALGFIANEELAGRISSLMPLHQRYLLTKRQVAVRTGCDKCSLSEPEFATLREVALSHIRHMSDADIELLKNHLVAKEMVFFEMKGDQRVKIVR